MNGEIKFRTGLGGYNKDDVNKYIKDTDIKFSTQIEDLEKAIDDLKAELEAKKAEIEETQKSAEESISQIRTELEYKTTALEDISSDYARAIQELEEKKNTNAALNDELGAEKDKNSGKALCRGKAERRARE